MDTDFVRPCFRCAPNLEKANEFDVQKNKTDNAPQTKITKFSGRQFGVSSTRTLITPSVQVSNSSAVAVLKPAIVLPDFVINAKAFKKQERADNLFKALVEAFVIVLIFAAAIAGIALSINYKYQGRAFPFTYIGDLAVGGMDTQQIKELLDSKYDDMVITFTEGGLTRTATLEQMGVNVDTKAVANKAAPQKKDLFALLNWQRYETPVKLNENRIKGYLARVIYQTQTESADAKIIVERNQLKIQPETDGFRTNPDFVVSQIKELLARVEEPNINTGAVVTSPKVRASDLTDDLARLSALLNTPVSVKIGYSKFAPTFKQKLSWINLSDASSKDVTLELSKGLVRNYITEQVKRYYSNDVSVKNIDESADAIIAAIKNGSPISQDIAIINREVASM